jgi:hypothetical protein
MKRTLNENFGEVQKKDRAIFVSLIAKVTSLHNILSLLGRIRHLPENICGPQRRIYRLMYLMAPATVLLSLIAGMK